MTTAYRGTDEAIEFIAPGARTSNQVEELPNCIGVWAEDVASGATGMMYMRGRFKLAKETGVAFAVGDKLFWDATNDRLDKTNTNIAAGLCAKAAASGDTTAEVLINIGPTP